MLACEMRAVRTVVGLLVDCVVDGGVEGHGRVSVIADGSLFCRGAGRECGARVVVVFIKVVIKGA